MKIAPEWKLFLGLSALFALLIPTGIVGGDCEAMFQTALALARDHTFVLSPEYWHLSVVGRDGQHFAPFYPLLPLLAAPLIAIFPYQWASAAALFSAELWVALSAVWVMRLAKRFNAPPSMALGAALAYAFGTIALIYRGFFFADPLLGFLAILAMDDAFADKPRRCLIWAALAVLAKPAGILLGPCLAVYFIIKQQKRNSMLVSTGTAVGIALYATFNMHRFGKPWLFGQPFVFSPWAAIEGLPGLLISPGRGLLIFCPPVIAAIVLAIQKFPQKRAEITVIAIWSIAQLLLHACWPFWSGGGTWGPRLLLPILPSLCALLGLAATRRARVWVLAAAVGGFLINAPALPRIPPDDNHQIDEHLANWSPRHSAIAEAWSVLLK